MSRSILLISGLALAACGGRPTAPKVKTYIDPPKRVVGSTAPIEKAIWFGTINVSEKVGTLARYDLESGALNETVLKTGSDTLVLRDGETGLFLLTRTMQDSITALSGPNAQVVAEFNFQEGLNPQFASRDSSGKIWVTLFDSNSVQVLASDLSQIVAQVDLKNLREPDSEDGFAELSQVLPAGLTTMAVTAQRLHRSENWLPEKKSGLALINSETLQVEHTELSSVTNPTVLLSRPITGSDFPQLVSIGAGDLGVEDGATSSMNWFSVQSRSSVANVTFPHLILSAVWSGPTSGTGAPSITKVAWFPKENKSCIFYGEKSLICEGSKEDGGYVFNRVLQYQNTVYASYIASGSAQLWIIPTAEDGGPIRKVNFAMPIDSMTFGP